MRRSQAFMLWALLQRSQVSVGFCWVKTREPTEFGALQSRIRKSTSGWQESAQCWQCNCGLGDGSEAFGMWRNTQPEEKSACQKDLGMSWHSDSNLNEGRRKISPRI